MKQKKKRKGIGNSLRFKILNRDDFTCRYCGRNSSDGVNLEIDHILPVSQGGKNDELNLVTACFDCNRGKSKRLIDKNPLDVGELVAKREKQLEDFEKYKQDVKRFYEQEEIITQNPTELLINEIIGERWGFVIIDEDLKKFRRLVEKAGMDNFQKALNITGGKNLPNNDVRFKYLCGVLWNLKKQDEDPHYKEKKIVKDYYLNHPSGRGTEWYLDYMIAPYVERLGVGVCIQAIDYIKGDEFELGTTYPQHTSYFMSLLQCLKDLPTNE